jgi:hypothetical protein
LGAGKGVGYEHWAKVFNLKQMAQTVNYLTEHKLLEYSAAGLKKKNGIGNRPIQSAFRAGSSGGKRLAEIAVLKTEIINYAQNPRHIHCLFLFLTAKRWKTM